MSYTSLVQYTPNASQTKPKPHVEWKQEVLSAIMKLQDKKEESQKKKIIIQAVMPWINTWMHPVNPRDPNNKNLHWKNVPADLTFDPSEVQTDEQLTGILTEEQQRILTAKNATQDYADGLRAILNDTNESAYTRVGKAAAFILSFCKNINLPNSNICILYNRGLRRWMKNTLRTLSMEEFLQTPQIKRDPLETMECLRKKWQEMTSLPFEYVNAQSIPRIATNLHKNEYEQGISNTDALELVQVRKQFYAMLSPYEILLLDPAYGSMPNRFQGLLGTKQTMVSSLFIDMISQPATDKNLMDWSLIATEHYDRHRSAQYKIAMGEVEQRTTPMMQWSAQHNLHWWINKEQYHEHAIRIPQIPNVNHQHAYQELIQRFPFLHKHPDQSPLVQNIAKNIKMNPNHDVYEFMFSQVLPIKGSSMAHIIDAHYRLYTKPDNALELPENAISMSDNTLSM